MVHFVAFNGIQNFAYYKMYEEWLDFFGADDVKY